MSTSSMACCPRCTACAMKRRASRCDALLGVFARELDALEENLEQLYDDQFIETCAEWVAPYIGELIGYRSLHGARAAHGLAARRSGEHHRLSAAQGHGADARRAGAQRHRLAGARGGVLRAARHHAVHESPAAACASHRRGALAARDAGRERTLQRGGAHRRDAPSGGGVAATTFPTSASSCGACSRIACATCRWSPIQAMPAAGACA